MDMLLTGRQRSLLQALTHAKTGDGQASMSQLFFSKLLALLLLLLLLGQSQGSSHYMATFATPFSQHSRELSVIQSDSESIVCGYWLNLPASDPATLMVPSLCLWQASVLRPPTQLADFCENLYYLGDKFCAPCCYHVTYVHQRPMFVFGHGTAVSSMPQALQCGMPRFVFIFLLHSR